MVWVKYDGGRFTPVQNRIYKNGELIEDYNSDDNSEMLIADGCFNVSGDLFLLCEKGLVKQGANGEPVDITTTDEYKQKEANEREAYFKVNFFETSLGWIRKTVNMKDGNTKDFLFDCFPLLRAMITQNGLMANSFLYYDLPDFTKDLTQEYMITLQHANPALDLTAATTFANECSAQIVKEFWG